MLTKEQKQEVVKKFRKSELDTGSPEVQIALYTYRIQELTEHFKTHKKDYAGQRGLVQMVNRRRSLLNYLSRVDQKQYQKLIAELGLRK